MINEFMLHLHLDVILYQPCIIRIDFQSSLKYRPWSLELAHKCLHVSIFSPCTDMMFLSSDFLLISLSHSILVIDKLVIIKYIQTRRRKIFDDICLCLHNKLLCGDLYRSRFLISDPCNFHISLLSFWGLLHLCHF